MGICLEKPITDKCNEQGAGNGLRYGVASMQGWRVDMEDTHLAKTGLEGDLSDWSYFALFDGHAGAGVSKHCATHLLDCILRTTEFKQDDVAKGIHSGFLQFDDEMRELPEFSEGPSGSTAVCAFVSSDKIYIANCGDSRAIICRNGVPILTTHDHKPQLPEERERIQQAGGSVMIGRVNGSLAVSRALGDYAYKKMKNLGPCDQLVSPEPEVLCYERDLNADEFLLLACDGIWDVISNEDVCTYVNSLLTITSNLQDVTNRLIDTCLAKGSYDNMSVVLVAFPGAPKPSAEAQRTDKRLEEAMYSRITELIQEGEQDPAAIATELRLLPDLLPGGGLYDKYALMEKYMDELGINKYEKKPVPEDDQ